VRLLVVGYHTISRAVRTRRAQHKNADINAPLGFRPANTVFEMLEHARTICRAGAVNLSKCFGATRLDEVVQTFVKLFSFLNANLLIFVWRKTV
jgi:hypothetical protein